MTTDTMSYITLGVSILALLASAFSAWMYFNANRIAIKANAAAEKANINSQTAIDMQKSSLNLQEAALESQLNSSITSAAGNIQQAVLALSNKNEDDKNIEIFEQNLKTAQELWLNSYDQACMSYREGKLNKETFKKTYHVSIRSIVENKNLESFFYPESKSRYQSIHIVYKEWETSQR
ncbi:hypothetical protein [Proteus penneri]|uniref:DUF1311 domain-containing protein n=1 Tax=Proteus penneri TaxID=102862 RepID=A0ABS0W4N1_9GAMM|nr:hypothetical protein [Proteus penneri]MBJ2118269.1 hypothetical protein [Proteus penneri]